MDQYNEYMKNTIIETIKNTTDKEIIQLIYGLLMNNDPTNQEQCPSTS